MTEIEPIRLLGKLDFMTTYLDRLKAYESVTLEEYLIYQRQVTAYIDSLEA